jgi:TatD DNase family protein
MSTPTGHESAELSCTYFDSHCHVHDERMPGGTAAAVAAAREAGVTTMVTVGCDRATSLQAIAAADAHPGVWATVGLHPHEARHGVDTIADLFDHPRVVAVGEAGLDYYYDHSPRGDQRTAFAAQIALAHELALPLVIHTRDAWDDTFDVLAAEGVPERTVFHCFTGGPDEARRCLDTGAFVSFSGIVTFKSAVEVQAAARLVPLDRLMIETDAPYLAPVPHRGRTNQPAWVTDVADFVADLLELPAATVATVTATNGAACFPRVAR